MTGTAPARIIHLDALRAFCMFYGILTHGASLDHGGEPLLQAVRVISELFRMATFFLIAGYFTAMVASKQTGVEYRRGRLLLIVLPLVTTLVTLVPITNYLIHTWHNGPMSLRTYFLEGGWAQPSLGKDVWHLHLWFLFSLFAYALATPALLALVRRPAVQAGFDRYVAATGGWTLWSNALLVALTVLAMRGVYKLALEPIVGGTRMDFIVAVTLNFIPYYALGVAMFVHAGLFRSMHRISWAGLLLSAGLYLVARYAGEGLPLMVERVMLWTGRAGAIMFIMAALLHAFEQWFVKASPTLGFFVDGAFTFYLFHLTGIYVVAQLVGPRLGQDVLMTFVVCVVTVPPLVLGLHRRVIAPNRILRLLYNGRLPKPALAAS
jgi:glucan biosynthesis protein C